MSQRYEKGGTYQNIPALNNLYLFYFNCFNTIEAKPINTYNVKKHNNYLLTARKLYLSPSLFEYDMLALLPFKLVNL